MRQPYCPHKTNPLSNVHLCAQLLVVVGVRSLLNLTESSSTAPD